MRILVTTNARLYKTKDGKYWTNMVYDYNFFNRYLKVFDKVRLIAHTMSIDYLDTKRMVRVDGPGLEIHEVYFPVGKVGYIKNYFKIKKEIRDAIDGCDGAILRIPDQLAFQVYNAIKENIPIAIEVTSNSWELFSPKNYKSIFRPFLRWHWHKMQKKVCANASGASYVTKKALQKVYPPKILLKGTGFAMSITDVNLDDPYYYKPRVYKENQRIFNLIHVAGSIANDAKGYNELLEAIGKLDLEDVKINLTLVGGGELSKRSKSIIKKYNIENIRLTGLLSDKKSLINELENADIFVFPSYNEGLPRVILEAMASGLPCVATKLSGIKELINEKYLVDVRNTKDLLDKLYSLIKNPKELTKESENNFAKAKEYHSEIISKKRTKFYCKFKNYLETN